MEAETCGACSMDRRNEKLIYKFHRKRKEETAAET
jgi:hypothetical protein